MKYILTITLALFISSNIHADEQKYIDEAKENADEILVSKFYLDNGKYGYNLSIYSRSAGYGFGWFRGGLEEKSSELCSRKGYKVLREETQPPNFRRQIIQCNE